MESFYSINYWFLAFVMAATAFTYNYMRLVQLRNYALSGDANLKTWATEHRPLVWVLTIFFGLLATYIFVQIYQVQLVLLLLIPGAISFLYPLTFKNVFSKFTSLRAVPGLKMFLIAITWSYVTVLMPAALYGSLTNEIMTEFILRSFLILGLVIPFDIRDVSFDEKDIQTLPQQLGVDKARQLAMFFVTVYQLWLVARFYFFEYSFVSVIALMIGFEAGFWLIKKSSPKRSEAYFSFWIEAVPIFAVVMLSLAHWLF